MYAPPYTARCTQRCAELYELQKKNKEQIALKLFNSLSADRIVSGAARAADSQSHKYIKSALKLKLKTKLNYFLKLNDYRMRGPYRPSRMHSSR